MGKRRKERESGTRLRKGVKKQVSNLNSVRGRGVKEALDAVYAEEDSRIDPALEHMMAMALAREDW